MKIITLLLLLTTIPLIAQSSDSPVPLPIWEAPIPKSQGEFTVSLNSICSIAIERYNLRYEKKTYPIVEFSIETVGGKTARFYYIDVKEKESPLLQPIKEAKEIFLPSGEEDDSMEDKKYRVVKIYPQSSTSTSVEYRLETESAVTDLYKELQSAWIKWAP